MTTGKNTSLRFADVIKKGADVEFVFNDDTFVMTYNPHKMKPELLVRADEATTIVENAELALDLLGDVLIGWNLTDADEKMVPITRENLEAFGIQWRVAASSAITDHAFNTKNAPASSES